MLKRKLEETSLYFLGETSLLIGNMKNSSDLKRELKKYISKMNYIPYETLDEIRKFNYTVEDFAFGAFMQSVMIFNKDNNSNKISTQELSAARKFEQFMYDTNMTHIELLSTSAGKSHYKYSDNKVYVGIHVTPLKNILKRSSIFDILMMTYLHEEGHRQDILRIEKLLELERIIKHYGTKRFIDPKTNEPLYLVKVPDRIFKNICKETLRSEIEAWKYAELASSQFNINKDDLYYYKTWALYTYINSHRTQMQHRKVRLADYLFISQ